MNVDKIKIEEFLTEYEIEVYEETNSTNELAKSAVRSNGKAAVFIAIRQTGGKGRNGKEFVSPTGGLYMSHVLRNLNSQAVPYVTAMASVAVSDAVEMLTDTPCHIKWVNDVIMNGFKICGISAECISNNLNNNCVILGIGINVSTAAEDFPPEIRGIANSIENITGKKIDINRLAAEVITNINSQIKNLNNEDYKFVEKYRAKSNLIGKDINVIDGKENIQTAKALAIDDDCSLLVRYNDGTTEHLRYGEVSVRGLN